MNTISHEDFQIRIPPRQIVDPTRLPPNQKRNRLGCSHCNSDPEKESLEDTLSKIQQCTNCQADLQMCGKWTGDGHRTMLYLVQKYGINNVQLTYERMKLEAL